MVGDLHVVASGHIETAALVTELGQMSMICGKLSNQAP